jgi:hypothetical protein
MRDHTHCRAHRDAELGPRGAGAPPGNLNALKHGRYSHPFSRSDLESLAAALIERPSDLFSHLDLAIQSIQARTGDPLMTLIALRVFIPQLTRVIAARLFIPELQALLQSLPPPRCLKVMAVIVKAVSGYSPERRLLFVRNVRKQLPEQNN